MKKINYLAIIIFAMLFASTTSAQDKIFLKAGNSIEAKILEINQNDVKYKKFDNLEGPTFTMYKNEVHMIEYENGQSEIFKNDKPAETNDEVFSEKQTSKGLKRNRFEASFGYVGYGFTEYDIESFSGFISAISYERILNESGLLGLKFKGEVGLTEDDETVATFGVALNVYPFKNAEWLYIGPSIKYGMLLYDDYYGDYESMSYLGLGLNIGSQFQITPLFGIRAGIEYDFIQIDDLDLDLGEMREFQFQLGFNSSF